jgi:hypothetical protein
MDFLKFGNANGQNLGSPYIEHLCTNFRLFKQLGSFIKAGFFTKKKTREALVPGPASDKLLILFDIDETLVHCDIKGITKTFETRTRIPISDFLGRKTLVG